MCMLALFGFLRCYDFTVSVFQTHYLLIKDIEFSENNSKFLLFLASSKTDPFSQGEKIPFYSNSVFCPVSCMQSYLSTYHSEPLNRESPLFLDEHNNPFNRGIFITYLRQMLVYL